MNSSSNFKFKSSNSSLKNIKLNYEYKLNPNLESVRKNKKNYEKNQKKIDNQKKEGKFMIQEKLTINIIQNPQIKFNSNDEKYRLFKLFKGFGNITKITFSDINK